MPNTVGNDTAQQVELTMQNDSSLTPNVLSFTSQYIIHTLKLNLKDMH